MSEPSSTLPSAENSSSVAGVDALKDHAGIGVGVGNVLIADWVGVDSTAGKILLLLVPFVTHSSQRFLDWLQLKAEARRKLKDEEQVTNKIEETIASALADPNLSPEFKDHLRNLAESLTEARLQVLLDVAVSKGIVRFTESVRTSKVKFASDQSAGAEIEV
jgi:hypothetical protein